MSISPDAGTEMTKSENRLQYAPATYWACVECIAANRRLHLARCYAQQYDRLDTEFANLRASQAWLRTQDSRKAAHMLVTYVQVLAFYLRQRGLDAELLRCCMDGLRACEQFHQNPGWLLLLLNEAHAALGHWDKALDRFQSAITASAEADSQTHARSVLRLGQLQFNQGNYHQALTTLTAAEMLLSATVDYEGLAAARSEVAAYHLNRGELDSALTLYLEIDHLRRQHGAVESSDHILAMLGVVYRRQREYNKAAMYLEHLCERSEAQRNHGTLAAVTHHLAWVCLNCGDVVRARRLCRRAITLYIDLGDIRGVSDTHEQLGLINLAEGQRHEALLYVAESLVARRRLGNQHGVASSLRRLAIVRLSLGHVPTGVRDLAQSIFMHWRLGVLSHQRLIATWRELVDWLVGQRRWTM